MAPAIKGTGLPADNSNEGYGQRASAQPAHRRLDRRGDDRLTGGARLGTPFAVNETAELVVDLLSATGLVAPDKLALVRGRAGAARSRRRSSTRASRRPRASRARSRVRHQVPLVDLALAGVDKEAAALIPLHVLERVVAIPYALDGGTLRVAIADPGNIHGIDELRLATRHSLDLGVASRDDILVELKRMARASEAFGARAVLEEAEDELDEQEDETDDLEADDGISDAPLVRLVNSVIFQAAEDGASDVHFEPQEDALVVRFRVDGVLQEVQRIPKRMTPGVTTRLKVLAKLDIAERRKPQDGRISLNAAAAGRMLDIRVATLPTVEGEKVVMRLLDKSRRAPTLEELGLSDAMRDQLGGHHLQADRRAPRHRADRLGQVDDLYAGLTQINRPEINIITVEDPGRVPARRRQPGADQPARRPDVRDRAALDPALRPGRGDGRRDPRRRDRQDLDRGRPHRSLRALDPAHERCSERDHTPERDGRRAVPHGRRRHGRARAAARAQALRALLRDVPAVGGGAARVARFARRGDGLGRHGLLPQARLPALQPDRLQGPRRRSTSC